MHAPERRPRVPLIAQLLFATVAGAITGKIFGPRAAALGDAALIFVDVLKLLATPLVFIAIVDTFVTTKLPLKRALVLLPVSALNAVVAAAIAIGLAHALPLARFVDLPRLRALAPAAPPGSRHLPSLNLMWVIAAALVVGLVLRAAGRTTAAQTIGRAVGQALRGLMHLVGVVVRVVPFAVFGVMAKVVGGSGLKLFPLLAIFVLLVALGMAIHILLWYALVLKVVARVSPNRFFRFAVDPLLTAVGVGSSLATLPVTLRTLDEMQVSPESARLAAVVGTNLNHDGIVLYEAAAALFVAQVYGVTLALAAQLRVVGLAVLAAVGIAGVPEAGLVTLSLVIGGIGLPLAAVPLLLPVDWMLGRLRAMTNVASDMTVANVLDRFR